MSCELSDVRESLHKLVSDFESYEPLIKVGKAIRILFLLQARRRLRQIADNEVTPQYVAGETGESSSEESLDEYDMAREESLEQNQIEAGNLAAHGANGLADEALFTSGAFSHTPWGEFYKTLYGVPPGSFKNRTRYTQRVQECEVRIRTTNPLRNGSSRALRLEAQRFIKRYREKFNVLMRENNMDLENWLTRLEELTERIVMFV